MVTTFMTSVWNEGGLQGASAGDAFQVGVGLGVTMTADDMLGGFMRVSVAMALTRPAEFVVVTYEQQQPKS
jgi:phage tail sheath protein FI